MKIIGLSKGVTRSLDYFSLGPKGFGGCLWLRWVDGRGGLLLEGLRD